MFLNKGNRVVKKYTTDNWATYKQTFYMRDANGEILAVYEMQQTETEREPAEIGEWYIYGSKTHGRFAVKKPESPIIYNNVYMIATLPTNYKRQLLFKEYEAKDHLGDVMATYTDLKLANYSSTQDPQQPFSLDLRSVSNYYPFGMLQPGRHWEASNYKYRFGYNGMEKDDDVKGLGNSYTTEFRDYDPRNGR